MRDDGWSTAALRHLIRTLDDAEPSPIWKTFQFSIGNFWTTRLLPYWETKGFIFVHGSVDPDIAMAQQSEATLQWKQFSMQKAIHHSGKIVVCGHERQESGLPAKSPFAICIDTGAWDSGWLTCLDAIAGQIWQSNERGQTRQLDLKELN